MNFEHIHSAYFLGIGGIGMSALARYFHHHGVQVAGYDRTETDLTKALEQSGIAVHYTDSPELIPANIDLFVWTPAVPGDLQELLAIRKQGNTLYKRAEVLGILSRAQRCIGIAGTHGKTSTSTLTAHILHTAGMEPTAFVGGISGNLKSNFLQGNGQWFVAEADEYDRSFLQLNPELAVLNSIDPDHLDIYGSAEAVVDAYMQFVQRINTGGALVYKYGLPIDSTVQILREKGVRVFTFGIENGDFKASNIRIENGFMAFDLKTPFNRKPKTAVFPYPGRHNVENALGASAAALLAGAPMGKVISALKKYKGVKRRFEFIYRGAETVYIDDYAHHPAELEATISAVKMLFPGKKVTGVFQPHLYSRTRDFANAFARALSALDVPVLLDIYPARELPIKGITSQTILGKMDNKSAILLKNSDLLPYIHQNKPEILLTLGAGDIDKFVKPIKRILNKK